MENLELIRQFKVVTLGLSVILMFFMSVKTASGNTIKQTTERTKLLINDRLRNTKLNYFNEQRINMYIKQYGIDFMFENITPLNYLAVKFIAALLCGLFAIKALNVFFAFPFGFIGFFVPDMLFKFSNEMDNEEMMPDIKRIYDTIRIQTKAGVYITGSLAECYLGVRNKRLKTALLDLNNQIIAKKDIETAIDEFNTKFKNNNIDNLCIVIKQSLDSGKSVQVLDDLTKQMADIQHAINLKEQERLDRSIQILELLMFIGMLGVAIYSMALELSASLFSF